MSASARKTWRRTSPKPISTSRSDVNLKGTFFTTQAVGKLMIAHKSGRIINISSQAGTVTLKGEAIYCMTKAAINHLTRCLAAEWAPHGITVNSVAPTFIWTDGTRPSLADPTFHAHVLGHIPLGRIGDPIDVAGTVVFLASPAASLITGANITGRWRLVGGVASVVVDMVLHVVACFAKQALHRGPCLFCIACPDRHHHLAMKRQEDGEGFAREAMADR